MRSRASGGSDVVCIHGAAAHLRQPRDLIIIATFAPIAERSARQHRPTVVLVDEKNQIKQAKLVEIPGPSRRPVAWRRGPPTEPDGNRRECKDFSRPSFSLPRRHARPEMHA
jgi:hypothetical protein